jgi:Protein of unknown function (DUF2786)
MTAPPAILVKVRKLIALATSSNANEATNARELADKLIAKYNITEQELASLDPKEYYGENEKLFITYGTVVWRQQLAVAVAKYFDCQIVQEEHRPAGAAENVTGEFHHYVYGDDDQVKDTQFVYHAFAKKINNLVETRCIGRGSIYKDSYCEGVVESVKWNIEMNGIDIPEIKKPIKKQEEKSVSIPTNGMIKSTDKEEPVENRRKNIDGTFIKDIMAYFKGIDDGKNLSFKDILELEVENEVASRMTEGEKYFE